MIAGIIAEYNPFHKGHEYHIQQTIDRTGADAVVVIMSGDFVQRGEPSIMNKYIRTRLALAGGADLVMELPVIFATAGAESFARGGISLLNSLGLVDCVSFGYEGGDREVFEQVADILAAEPPEFKEELDKRLREGATFPQARQAAVEAAFHGKCSCDLAPILSSPNNILALEYLKALRELNSSMKPVFIERQGDGYNQAITGAENASATGIRQVLTEHLRSHEKPDIIVDEAIEKLGEHLTDECADTIRKEAGYSLPLIPDDFIHMVGDKIRLDALRGRDFTEYLDISSELAGRILKIENSFSSHEDVCNALKTRQYTYSRISRVLTHILLEITVDVPRYAPYARLLGFRESASGIVKEITRTSAIPVISKVSKSKDLLAGKALSAFERDAYASRIYEMCARRVFGNEDLPPFNEYRQNPIIV